MWRRKRLKDIVILYQSIRSHTPLEFNINNNLQNSTGVHRNALLLVIMGWIFYPPDFICPYLWMWFFHSNKHIHIRSTERYHSYVKSSKRTLEKGRGTVQVTDFDGPPTWVMLIMRGKLETGEKGRISWNIPLWIGPSDSGTSYLQIF